MSFHTDFMSRPIYNGMECSLSALRGDLWEICEAKVNEVNFGWKREKYQGFQVKFVLVRKIFWMWEAFVWVIFFINQIRGGDRERGNW